MNKAPNIYCKYTLIHNMSCMQCFILTQNRCKEDLAKLKNRHENVHSSKGFKRFYSL